MENNAFGVFVQQSVIEENPVTVEFTTFTGPRETDKRPIADINFPGKKEGTATIIVGAYLTEETIFRWKESDGWQPLDTNHFDGAWIRGWERVLIAEINMGDPPIAVG